ncbi:hypothetical protein KSP40_PGU000622 [Platanthera guangdongensis]|uniref:Uncharacterized protein n=1 Tax=Platanthera guangdongensis TaxID=2320717 RepID=A0ABR2MGY0_9ASPA
MSGNTFNAFKARVPVTWSPRLFITLVCGLPGTRKLHRRTLTAMRLRCCKHTVKRLVVVETEEMHNARKQEKKQRSALRPPIIVKHAPPSSSSSATVV